LSIMAVDITMPKPIVMVPIVETLTHSTPSQMMMSAISEPIPHQMMMRPASITSRRANFTRQYAVVYVTSSPIDVTSGIAYVVPWFLTEKAPRGY